ncbi:MAG: hypothetical protein DMD78_00235 [Candidatus Rokuibacteriota bacterium]|nr:MAG: hypothetical protein DMD78_00235 [Candidatus Rokubacteria bacterium]
MRLLFLIAALGLTLAACQRSSPPLLSSAGSLAGQLTAEGDALMAQGDYERAAVKYQSVLNEAPNEIAIRYALAVALSYTTRRDETIHQFKIVVSRGAPSSAEVKAAREWLAGANVLEETSISVIPSIAQAEGGVGKAGRVVGRIQWHDIDPHERMARITVSLTGEDVATRNVTVTRPFKIGYPYEFRNIPPGSYRLLAEVGGTPMWDMKIDVSADNDTALDLTEANSTVPKDFDPTRS